MKTQIQPELYVPRCPSDFIGPAQDVAAILKAKAARLSKDGGHAKLLLHGPYGVGKSRLALMFAAGLTEHGKCNRRLKKAMRRYNRLLKQWLGRKRGVT